MSVQVASKDRELTITRMFDAPPELVFEMWTSCEHLKHWWGPKEWPMVECRLDFREGGEWHFCLRGPNDGDESWGKAIYKEIREPEKIVYEDYFSDKDGKINNEMPGMLITVEFIAQDGKTKQINTTRFDTAEMRKKIEEMGVVEGMSSSMDRLDEYLAKIQE